jgi:hypothetical protein
LIVAALLIAPAFFVVCIAAFGRRGRRERTAKLAEPRT